MKGGHVLSNQHGEVRQSLLIKVRQKGQLDLFGLGLHERCLYIQNDI